ncbi:MAG: ECF-type riboflavin transporter substrate-binding protein [Treponema sp.]|jgi:energy-coupling factor transport system substrate-specific component|nr:ECF-type riboflavin transporter substrate-binding protein [Treponema sp.]
MSSNNETVEKKKLFEFKTITIVAIGLGAAIFTLLFMFVKIPSPVPETSFQTAYGIAGFFGALFGPIAGALIAFIGHAISDAVQYGSPWWSWVVASGVSGFVYGISYKFLRIREGHFNWKSIVIFNVVQIIGNVIAWIVVAPVLDILVYKEPVNLVFTQGAVALVMNSVSCAVIGSVLLSIYAATRMREGSLKKGGDA